MCLLYASFSVCATFEIISRRELCSSSSSIAQNLCAMSSQRGRFWVDDDAGKCESIYPC